MRLIDGNGQNYPLHEACLFGTLETVKKLVYSGSFHIDGEDRCGLTPLGLVALQLNMQRTKGLDYLTVREYEEKFKFLLVNGANPMRWWMKTTIADIIFRGRNKNLITITVEYIESINRPLNDSGQTALLLAIRKGFYKITKRILARNANINEGNYFAAKPLFCAILYQTPQFINLLVEHGASLECRNGQGETPLHVACCNPQKKDIILRCLPHDSYMYHRDNYGFTPMHRLVSQSAKKTVEAAEIIEIFIDRDFDLDSKDCRGRTPLQICLRKNLDPLATLFLRNGAHLEITKDTFANLIPRIPSKSVQVSRALLKYMAVENSKGVPINQEMKQRLCRHPEAYGYVLECYDEINLLKSLKIENTSVKYWSLLTKSIREIAFYTDNPFVIEGMKSFKIDAFPIYGPEILYKFSKGKRRMRLMYQCAEALNIMWERNIPTLVTDIVFDRLSIVDLENVKIAGYLPYQH